MVASLLSKVNQISCRGDSVGRTLVFQYRNRGVTCWMDAKFDLRRNLQLLAQCQFRLESKFSRKLPIGLLLFYIVSFHYKNDPIFFFSTYWTENSQFVHCHSLLNSGIASQNTLKRKYAFSHKKPFQAVVSTALKRLSNNGNCISSQKLLIVVVYQLLFTKFTVLLKGNAPAMKFLTPWK